MAQILEDDGAEDDSEVGGGMFNCGRCTTCEQENGFGKEGAQRIEGEGENQKEADGLAEVALRHRAFALAHGNGDTRGGAVTNEGAEGDGNHHCGEG